MCGPKFCSMEITQQVRDYAARLNEAAVELAEETTQVDPKATVSVPECLTPSDRQAGMDGMSAKFRELGAQVYVESRAIKGPTR
jgi:phosphomethylpyrimidine synthase